MPTIDFIEEKPRKKIDFIEYGPVQTSAQPEGFFNTLASEVGGGFRDIGEGAREIFPSQGGLQSYNPLSALKAPLGAARVLTAPQTALSRKVGQKVQDLTVEPLGPTGSAILATGADLATQVGTGAILGKGIQLARKGFQKLAPGLPGAGTALREEGQRVVEAVRQGMNPKIASDHLYGLIQQQGISLELPRFKAIADELASNEARLAKYGLGKGEIAGPAGKSSEAVFTKATQTVSPILGPQGQQIITTTPAKFKEVPFSEVRQVRQRIGELISAARTKGDAADLSAFKRMFRELSNDLERSSGTGPAFDALRAANKVAKKEFALGELDDIFNATIGRALEAKDITSTNFAQALNKIRDLARKEPNFVDGLGGKELAAIESTLDRLRKIKMTPPPKGLNAGSMLRIERGGIGGGVGTAIGALVAGPPGAIIGGGIGTAGGLLIPKLISNMLQTDNGRKLLIRFIETPGGLTPAKVAMMSAFVRATTGENFVSQIGEQQ